MNVSHLNESARKQIQKFVHGEKKRNKESREKVIVTPSHYMHADTFYSIGISKANETTMGEDMMGMGSSRFGGGVANNNNGKLGEVSALSWIHERNEDRTYSRNVLDGSTPHKLGPIP